MSPQDSSNLNDLLVSVGAEETLDEEESKMMMRKVISIKVIQLMELDEDFVALDQTMKTEMLTSQEQQVALDVAEDQEI